MRELIPVPDNCPEIPTELLVIRDPNFISPSLGSGVLDACYMLRTPNELGMQHHPDRPSRLIVPRGEEKVAIECFKNCPGSTDGENCQAIRGLVNHLHETRVFRTGRPNLFQRLNGF